MSRGLGNVQRRIIEILDEHGIAAEPSYFDPGWMWVSGLIHMFFNGHSDITPESHETTESEKQSIWRALRTLKDRGVLVKKRMPVAGLMGFGRMCTKVKLVKHLSDFDKRLLKIPTEQMAAVEQNRLVRHIQDLSKCLENDDTKHLEKGSES